MKIEDILALDYKVELKDPMTKEDESIILFKKYGRPSVIAEFPNSSQAYFVECRIGLYNFSEKDLDRLSITYKIRILI